MDKIGFDFLNEKEIAVLDKEVKHTLETTDEEMATIIKSIIKTRPQSKMQLSEMFIVSLLEGVKLPSELKVILLNKLNNVYSVNAIAEQMRGLQKAKPTPSYMG